jgi:glycosyltransferase involved in cell wall biosynthesis
MRQLLSKLYHFPLRYNLLVARICIIPKAINVGGVASFQAKLTAGLERRGFQTCFDLEDMPYEAVLLTAGVRNLPGLDRARRRGVRIIQRLDGINWVQRRRRTSLRYWLRAEYGNFIISYLRRHFANRVVYQSEFVHSWWEDWFGPTQVPYQVIHNGVDLNIYTPDGTHSRPTQNLRLLVVEGSLAGGLDFGLHLAVDLARQLARTRKVELVVLGSVSPGSAERVRQNEPFVAQFPGLVGRERIPEIDRSAHLLFSAESLPPCPNSVIEALACGLPVTGFATGALPELVTGDAGRLVPYGSDPWKLEKPDLPALVDAAAEILDDQPKYRAAARQRAEAAFGLDQMVDSYLDVLLG